MMFVALSCRRSPAGRTSDPNCSNGRNGRTPNDANGPNDSSLAPDDPKIRSHILPRPDFDALRLSCEAGQELRIVPFPADAVAVDDIQAAIQYSPGVRSATT